jgi:putative ABC transport system permease protein
MRVSVLEHVVQELRYASRRLLRSPIFTGATVLTLALALGANVAIFAVVQRVLINPLPYPDSGRLIVLDYGWPSRNIASGIASVSSRMYYAYTESAHVLDGVALYDTYEVTIAGDREPERIRISRATPSLASVLRVGASMGRWFSDQDSVPGTAPVVVLSDGLWTRRYGRDPGILDRRVMVNGISATVIGVMPPAFRFPDPRIELWTPVPLTRATATDAYEFSGVARLRPEVTLADARGDLTRVTNTLDATYPRNGYSGLRSTALTLMEATTGRVASMLWILLISVGLVLLVACANVANLVLVRSETRQRDIAVRRALGAGNGRITTYFLSESLLLSLAGGALGLLLASAAVDLLVALAPPTFPRLEEVRIDPIAVIFALLLSVLSAAAFGAIPLLRLPSVASALNELGRGSMVSRRSHRVRQVLMAGQVALALVLLVGSGLLLRSFERLRAVDPGFNPGSTLTFRLGLPSAEYPDRARVVTTHQAILDRLAMLPGVSAVSATSCVPLNEEGGFCHGSALQVEGRPPIEGAGPTMVALRAVAGQYFAAIGQRVVRGRVIDRSDLDRNEPVVVVNEALARVVFPNTDPIGKRVKLVPVRNPDADVWLTIVGIVSNTPTRALAEPTPVPQLYMPLTTRPMPGPNMLTLSYVLRTPLPPQSVVPAVRVAVNEINHNLAIAQARSMQDLLDRSAAQLAFTMVLLVIAGGVALVLGVIGIYGMMSYIVTQRTSEMGLRLALGAAPSGITGLIIRQGLGVALIGLAGGLVLALAGTRVIGSLLYNVSPRDPEVFVFTTVTLLCVALLACWLPARRAGRLSPLDALRKS